MSYDELELDKLGDEKSALFLLISDTDTTYIVRVHFSQTAKETMEDKIKRMLREEVRKM